MKFRTIINPWLATSALLLYALASGCTTSPGKGNLCGSSPLLGGLNRSVDPNAFDPFDYHKHIKSLSRAELDKERADARQALEDKDRLSTRVRLALILSLPNAPHQNLTHARSLLEMTGDKNVAEDCDRSFTDYLANQIGAREKEANWARSLNSENKDLRQRLGIYKEEVEIKTEQLEQLKEIDKNIDQRADPNLTIPQQDQ